MRHPTKKKRRKIPVRNILSSLLFLFAIGLLLYPIVGNYFISQKTAQMSKSYERTVNSLTASKKQKLLNDAALYNAKLYNEYVYDASLGKAIDKPIPSYDNTLRVDDSGMMGYLEIPQISLKNVPIYHGVDQKTLEGGIGHIPQTSLPIGGANTHSVLSAHSGRANDVLFTDLDKLKKGDYFLLHVLGQTLKYEVTNIKIVDPTDTSSLGIVKDQDLVTLITCWPTGINNKRLLVTGFRVPYTAPTAKEKVQRNTYGYNFWVLGGLSLLIFLIVIYWIWTFLAQRTRLYFIGDREIKHLGDDNRKLAEFGEGVYLTNSRKFAERLSSAQENAIINVYRFKQKKDLRRLTFQSRSETWSKFIQDNTTLPSAMENEVIIGPPAARSKKKIRNYNFRDSEALDHLIFKKSYKPKN